MMTHLHAGLSSETMEKARLELNENPDTLHQDIQQVNAHSTHLSDVAASLQLYCSSLYRTFLNSGPRALIISISIFSAFQSEFKVLQDQNAFLHTRCTLVVGSILVR